jgi:hypothetical protein
MIAKRNPEAITHNDDPEIMCDRFGAAPCSKGAASRTEHRPLGRRGKN